MPHIPNKHRHSQGQRQHCRSEANEINDSKSRTASTAGWCLRDCAIEIIQFVLLTFVIQRASAFGQMSKLEEWPVDRDGESWGELYEFRSEWCLDRRDAAPWGSGTTQFGMIGTDGSMRLFRRRRHCKGKSVANLLCIRHLHQMGHIWSSALFLSVKDYVGVALGNGDEEGLPLLYWCWIVLTQVHCVLMVGVMMRDIHTLGQDDGWELTELDLWTKPKPSEHRQKYMVAGEQPQKSDHGRTWIQRLNLPDAVLLDFLVRRKTNDESRIPRKLLGFEIKGAEYLSWTKAVCQRKGFLACAYVRVRSGWLCRF